MSDPFDGPPDSRPDQPPNLHEERAVWCRSAIGRCQDALSRALDALAVGDPANINWTYVHTQFSHAFDAALDGCARSNLKLDDEDEPNPSTADLIDLRSTPGTITDPFLPDPPGGES